MTIIDRAKEIGLRSVREWVPSGHQEGGEWVCLNPTRADTKEGSFKINLKTGRWADFADDMAGNDVVSLYAYLYNDACASRLTNYSGTNYNGAVQVEAAKIICENYDTTYFPGTYDETIKKTKSNNWAGWNIVTNCDNAPDIAQRIESMRKYLNGDYINKWAFHDARGHIVGYVVRYIVNGKKDDRPFTLWSNGREKKWRVKGPEQWPLYNLPEIIKKENTPVLLVEGQKCAEAAREHVNNFVVTGYYGAVKNTDFDPLTGRTVYYWFDPDLAGRKKMIKVKEVLEQKEVLFFAIHSPAGKQPGWDIADAIKEEWTPEQIEEYIYEQKEQKPETFLDDNNFSFKIIGMTSTNIYFFPKEMLTIYSVNRNNVGKNTLRNVMPDEKWYEYFPKINGADVDWDAAANFIIKLANKKPIYDASRVRGAGAWVDNGSIIINAGTKLLTEQKEVELFDQDSSFFYEKKESRPYTYKNPMEDASFLIEFLSQLRFFDFRHSLLLSGWILLAPFCGALTWRPHVWLTGPKGSGKSWLLDNLLNKIYSSFALIAQGSSTPAGIRQKLNNSTLPFIMDEAESDIIKQKDKIEEILTMARQASSGAEFSAGIMHGSENMHGREWIVRSMFLFASIGASLKHEADRSRWTILQLKQPIRDESVFSAIEQQAALFTPEWGVAFVARTATIIDEVFKAVTIFRSQASAILKNRRAGDQLGTLFAGAYMVTHNTAPIASECAAWLNDINLAEYDTGAVYKDDENLCLDEILSHRVEIVTASGIRHKTNISAMIHYYFAKEAGIGNSAYLGIEIGTDTIKTELEMIGIKIVTRNKNKIQIAKGHPGIKKILRETAWDNNYCDFLLRLTSYNAREAGPGDFSGIRKRFVELDAVGLMNEGIENE